MVDAAAFERFTRAHRDDLRRISRHTNGESSMGDVQSEAWLMLHALADKGKPVDLDAPADVRRLLAHLYQHLVRYTELQVRHAVRLDHSPDGDEQTPHPLALRLAAQPHFDPLVALRRFRLVRAPVQLCFDFETGSDLFENAPAAASRNQ